MEIAMPDSRKSDIAVYKPDFTSFTGVNAEKARKELIKLIDGGAEGLIIDMDEVQMVDSIGLGGLVSSAKRLRTGRRLVILNAGEKVREVIRLSGLESMLIFADTKEGAIDLALG